MTPEQEIAAALVAFKTALKNTGEFGVLQAEKLCLTYLQGLMKMIVNKHETEGRW